MLQIVTSALTFTVFSGVHAQTQCLPCPPLFHGRTGWAVIFFTGFGNWYSYKPQAKNSFSGIYCLEQGCQLEHGCQSRKRWGDTIRQHPPIIFHGSGNLSIRCIISLLNQITPPSRCRKMVNFTKSSLPMLNIDLHLWP